MKIKYIDESKFEKREIVEAGHADKKEKYTTNDELEKEVSSKTFKNSTPLRCGCLLKTNRKSIPVLSRWV